MKKTLKKISILFLSLALVTTSTNFLAPTRAYAIDTVTDFFNGVFNVLTSVASGVSSAAQTALGVNKFTTQVIARAMVRISLQQLTMSIVNWINNGFEGSPSFVTNPALFFQNIGDQLAGRFLMADGDLKFLCSPFSLDVRLALIIKMQGGSSGDPYACTLTGAIRNATNAVNNFTITGFIQGDFRQGGWPAFVALTTIPTNSPNGAFLKAKNDLETKISSKVSQKTNELLQGAGFLSSEQCSYYQVDAGTGKHSPITKDDYTSANKVNDANNSQGIGKENCVTTTPGSIISGSLQKALNVPTDELLLAQDIDAIITVAFSQLALKTLQLGLSALGGGPSSTEGTNYLQQIQVQSAADFKTTKANTSKSISQFIGPAQSIKTIADTSLGLAITAGNTLNATISCYNNAANSASTTPMYQVGVAFARSQASSTQQVFASQVAPLIISLTTTDIEASSTVQSFIDLQTSISTAQTADDLNTPTQILTNLSVNGQLPTATDVQAAKNAQSDLKDTLNPIQVKANTWLQQCRSFDVRTYPNGTMTMIDAIH